MSPMPLRTAPTTALVAAMLAAVTGIATPTPVIAQDYYVGQMLLSGSDFCPRGSAPAQGQLLPIAQNPALFALLGTTFGGNGTTTFALPDLRGRAIVAAGTGPGLPGVSLGQPGGQVGVTLTPSQMPAHSHQVIATASGSLQVSSGPATAATAAGNTLSNAASDVYADIDQPSITLPPGVLEVEVDANTTAAGGNQPFDNRSPYLGLTYCIFLQGIFPSRD